MDSCLIALLIAIISPTVGVAAILIIKPKIKEKTNNRMKLNICNIAFAVGMIIYISFLICTSKGSHIGSSVTYKEYPIQKLTFSNVYFNDRDGYSFNESWVILESPNDKYQNVVVVETEEYVIQWLFKIRTDSSKYHVYLSEEVYNRFQYGNVIYKSEE